MWSLFSDSSKCKGGSGDILFIPARLSSKPAHLCPPPPRWARTGTRSSGPEGSATSSSSLLSGSGSSASAGQRLIFHVHPGKRAGERLFSAAGAAPHCRRICSKNTVQDGLRKWGSSAHRDTRPAPARRAAGEARTHLPRSSTGGTCRALWAPFLMEGYLCPPPPVAHKTFWVAN